MTKRFRLRAWPLAVIVAASVPILAPSLLAQRATSEGAWLTWGGDDAFTRYSPLAAITRDNVKELKVLWRWQAADRDLQTSQALWRSGPQRRYAADGERNTLRHHRAGHDRRARSRDGENETLGPRPGKLQGSGDPAAPRSFSAASPTGPTEPPSACWPGRTMHTSSRSMRKPASPTGIRHGRKGRSAARAAPGANRAMRQVSPRRPLIAGNIVVMGSAINDGAPNKEMPPGYVQAFDVRTGKPLWRFHTVPRAGEFGIETWEANARLNTPATRTCGPAWCTTRSSTTSTCRRRRPPTTTTAGIGSGDNLFAESLVCVEAKTGRRVWHFQAVHHGLWDYDFPATPILGDITVNGRRIKAVMQPSKQAFLYVFDRKTGEPVWPIEERPVPQSTVPGERAVADAAVSHQAAGVRSPGDNGRQR